MAVASFLINLFSSKGLNSVSVALSNIGDQVIRVEIASANFDRHISAAAITSVKLNIGQTYNLRLTKGRTVKNTNYTPDTDGATLEISRYFA